MTGAGTKQKKRRMKSVRKPTRWQQSSEWRQIGRTAISRFNAKRHLLPKCGAHARSSGKPCRQLALANGRCRWHGGKTPAGDQYGIRQFTPKPRSRQTKRDWPRAQAKIDRLNREDKDRQRRLALMTPDEFQAYFRRTYKRHDRQFRRIVDGELRRRGMTSSKLLPEPNVRADTTTSPSAELIAINTRIAALRAMQAEPRRVLTEISQGVFE